MHPYLVAFCVSQTKRRDLGLKNARLDYSSLPNTSLGQDNSLGRGKSENLGQDSSLGWKKEKT